MTFSVNFHSLISHRFSSPPIKGRLFAFMCALLLKIILYSKEATWIFFFLESMKGVYLNENLKRHL